MGKQTGNESMKPQGSTGWDSVVGLGFSETEILTQDLPKPGPLLNLGNGSESDEDKLSLLIPTSIRTEFFEAAAMIQSLYGTGAPPDALERAYDHLIACLTELLGPIGALIAGPSDSPSTPNKSSEKPCEKRVLDLPPRKANGNRNSWQRNSQRWAVWRYYAADGAYPHKWVAYGPEDPATDYMVIKYFRTHAEAIDYVWLVSSTEWLASVFSEYFDHLLGTATTADWKMSWNRGRIASWMMWFRGVKDMEDAMDRVEGL